MLFLSTYNSKYFVYKVLWDSMKQKPRFGYSKNSKKIVLKELPIERVSPKIDKNQFLCGCNRLYTIMTFGELVFELHLLQNVCHA